MSCVHSINVLFNAGWSASLAIRKGREFIDKIVEDKQYDYKQPILHSLAVPYQVDPGKVTQTPLRDEYIVLFSIFDLKYLI